MTMICQILATVHGGVQIWGNNRLPDPPSSVKHNLTLQSSPRSVSANHNINTKLQASNDASILIDPARPSSFCTRNFNSQTISKQCPLTPPSTSWAPLSSTLPMARTLHPAPPHLHRTRLGPPLVRKTTRSIGSSACRRTMH